MEYLRRGISPASSRERNHLYLACKPTGLKDRQTQAGRVHHHLAHMAHPGIMTQMLHMHSRGGLPI